ncbi:MAG: TetR/AcrR family transcriptional regulator [Myxococcota bacterium]
MTKHEQASKRPRRRVQRANGAETRRKLLATALALFSDGGYKATSLRSIASQTGVDLATLKYHFGDKSQLFAEVYRQGHEEFIVQVQPLFAGMAQVTTREELREQIRALVLGVHRYLDAHMDFARLALYRVMEDGSEISDVEEELQGVAIGVLDGVLQKLVDRAIIRPLDTRAFLAFLVTSVPVWFVTCAVKPGWVGDPVPGRSPEGRRRSEAFLQDMLERMLLAEGSHT